MVRRLAVGAGMIVVLGLMVWVGVRNLGARRAQMQAAQQQSVTITKDSPDAGPGESKLIGQAAPAFTLTTLDGKKVSLADYKGRPVVINFWATWCAPCKLEMPWFEEFQEKFKAGNVAVLGISEDDSAPKDEIAKAAHKAGVTYPILLHSEATTKAYGNVEYLPETIYVNAHGVIEDVTAGAPSKDEMEQKFRKLVAAGAN